MNIQEKLEFSTEIISKTKLIGKYLHAMARSSIHHQLLQYFIIDLNLHIAQQGNDINHPTMSIHSIYRHLIITNAPQQFQIKPTKKFKPNISQFSQEIHQNDIHTERCYEDSTEDIKDNQASTIDNLSTYILQNDNDVFRIQLHVLSK